MTSLARVQTIGVYGSTEEGFFAALRSAGAEVLVDVRARRGVRGSQYAFVNSTRLQQHLRELGIDYLHLKELAPTERVRASQREADVRAGLAKRDRERLSPAFISAYRAEVLDRVDLAQLIQQHGLVEKSMVFLCVEGPPQACHRSLVADEVARILGTGVEHLNRGSSHHR